MTAPKGLLNRLYDKKWFILALVLVFITSWSVFTYFEMAQKPIESIDISPMLHSQDVNYTLSDGTEITPNEKGVFVLPEPSTTLFCTLPPESFAGRLTPSALIVITSRTCDVAVFADGKLVADPSHSFDTEKGIFGDTNASGGSGLFSIGSARELTLALRFRVPEASVKALPSLTIYPEQYAYSSIYLTDGAKAALPAGIFLTLTIALILLFLFQLYNKKANTDILLLSLVSLSFCLLETIPFGIYVVSYLQTPFVTYTLRLLPTLMLLWILWYRTRGKMHRFGWIYPLVWTLAVATGIIWRQIDIKSGNAFTNLLQGKLLPIAMLIALVLCGWQAIRGNKTYRKFFAMGGCIAVIAGLMTAISYSNNGELWITIKGAFSNTALLGYFEPLQLLNQFLLILLFFVAAYDFVMQIIRRNAELQALTLQNRYATENAAHLKRSLDETHELRHEMKHHIDALKALCSSGDMERVTEYVGSLSGDFCGEPSRYTDHDLINALVSSCCQRAKALEADFEATVQIPEIIGIEDADIAVVLSNVIDNAIDALSDISDKKERKLRLKVAIFEDAGMFISCINTFEGERKQDETGAFISTKSDEGHGIGLKAMQRVAEKYNSIILPEIEGNTFHIKTYLYFKK